MHHTYGIAGLIANILGTFMLLYFPPETKAYEPDGSEKVAWVGPPTAAGRREYLKLKNGFKLGFWLLLLGFLLQLLDLLIAP